MTDLPGDRELVQLLKDGYWERTALVRTAGGELRVRKESRGGDAEARPWARESLRREIRYLQTLPAGLEALFPPLLERWGEEESATGPLGYEMAYCEGWADLGSRVQRGVGASTTQELGGAIAETIIGRLQEERTPRQALSAHVSDVMSLACRELANDAQFEAILDADVVEIDGRAYPGMRRSLAAVEALRLFERLDASPQVRLHGDLILENILVRDNTPEDSPPLLLIDPVSVAGVACGHPAFDLVKYESYASGELYAIRSGATEGHALDGPGSAFSLNARGAPAAIDHFSAADLGTPMRAAYIERYGEPDSALEHLLDAYFSLAMAINTTGAQPLTRVLMAVRSLAAIDMA